MKSNPVVGSELITRGCAYSTCEAFSHRLPTGSPPNGTPTTWSTGVAVRGGRDHRGREPDGLRTFTDDLPHVLPNGAEIWVKEVRGWRVAGGTFQPLDAQASLAATCTDGETDEPIPPEHDVRCVGAYSVGAWPVARRSRGGLRVLADLLTVAAPSGARIRGRLRVSATAGQVLTLLGGHLGAMARRDLAPRVRLGDVKAPDSQRARRKKAFLAPARAQAEPDLPQQV
ncbi:MAG: hypothetical protein WCG47_22130 [Dermatophilaceae bacterium]